MASCSTFFQREIRDTLAKVLCENLGVAMSVHSSLPRHSTCFPEGLDFWRALRIHRRLRFGVGYHGRALDDAQVSARYISRTNWNCKHAVGLVAGWFVVYFKSNVNLLEPNPKLVYIEPLISSASSFLSTERLTKNSGKV